MADPSVLERRHAVLEQMTERTTAASVEPLPCLAASVVEAVAANA